MKPSAPSSRPMLRLATIAALFQQAAALAAPDSAIQGRLLDKCCRVGKTRALDSPKFNCKLSAREALLGEPVIPQQGAGRAGLARDHLLGLAAAEAALLRAAVANGQDSFADQCEMVLESCCMSHHRTRNCDSGKHFAKSGASCMDVELSKETTVATESFNDCCMSCSLGILAARSPQANDTRLAAGSASVQTRCKLLAPLATSFSGQLYEQTYIECCQDNLPRASNALVEPGAPIDCAQSNPCAQRCVSRSFDITGHRSDRCECFSGYHLASDGVNCLDVDECKLNQHSCDRRNEVCDNTRGGFRCLAREGADSAAPMSASLSLSASDSYPAASSAFADTVGGGVAEFSSLRLCPLGSRWNSREAHCERITSSGSSLSSSRVLISRLADR